MKTVYIFFRENKTSQKFELTINQIRDLFYEWMKSQDIIWLESTSITNITYMFIASKEGLNSVYNNNDSDIDEIAHVLKDVKWDYIDKINKK